MLTKTHMNRACELSAAIINLDVSPINRGKLSNIDFKTICQ